MIVLRRVFWLKKTPAGTSSLACACLPRPLLLPPACRLRRIGGHKGGGRGELSLPLRAATACYYYSYLDDLPFIGHPGSAEPAAERPGDARAVARDPKKRRRCPS